jgi:hypothetical protein
MDTKINLPKINPTKSPQVNVLQGLSNPQNLTKKKNNYLTPECKGLMNPPKSKNDNYKEFLNNLNFVL